MIAQVLKIELNAKKEGNGGKSYSGIAVTYQPPAYKGQEKPPTTRFLFGNSDVAKQFKSSGVSEGDWVDIAFDNTKWKTQSHSRKQMHLLGAVAVEVLHHKPRVNSNKASVIRMRTSPVPLQLKKLRIS